MTAEVDVPELCDCIDVDKYPLATHTEADHRGDCSWARGTGPVDTACGGCWGCQRAQVRYYETLGDK